MHLDTIQHLRNVAGRHDDLVPIAKPLLLDLLDSYERHASQEHRLLTGLVESERELAQLREAGTPACPAALNIVILQQLLKADDYDSIEAVKAAAQDYLHSLNACPLDFAHQPHDHCDGTAASSRQPVNQVNQVNPVTSPQPPNPEPETFESHGYTWTRHTPGDPCPVSNPDALVYVLTSFGGPSEGKPSRAGLCLWHVIKNINYARGEIIGWRYAEPQPSTPDK